MPCTLILEGDFKKIKVCNRGRSCMIKFTREIKEGTHYQVPSTIELWIEKDSKRFCFVDNEELNRRDLQIRMSIDHDLDLYALCMDNKVIQVWLYNCVD